MESSNPPSNIGLQVHPKNSSTPLLESPVISFSLSFDQIFEIITALRNGQLNTGLINKLKEKTSILSSLMKLAGGMKKTRSIAQGCG